MSLYLEDDWIFPLTLSSMKLGKLAHVSLGKDLSESGVHRYYSSLANQIPEEPTHDTLVCILPREP